VVISRNDAVAHRENREGREVLGTWMLKKSDSPIGESESKGHAIQWLGRVFRANCFNFAHFVVNCMEQD
jgi:hypothetical protein